MTRYVYLSFEGVGILNALLPKAINIMECPEFRALLLLLRSDLKDSEIPHRTKLRGLVIHYWKGYFVSLKEDLAVRIFSSH